MRVGMISGTPVNTTNVIGAGENSVATLPEKVSQKREVRQHRCYK